MASNLHALLYRKVLQAARRCDTHPLSAKALLCAPPTSVFDRQRRQVVELEPKRDMSRGDVPVEAQFQWEELLRRYVTNRAEFYLPKIAATQGRSEDNTLQGVVRRIRQDAAAAYATAVKEQEEVAASQLDTFFGDLGFEAMRELSALGNAADELLLSPSSAPSLPALPFSLEISPDAGEQRYDRDASYREWDDMVLMTHPTACLGQPTLHGAVIVMTPRQDDSEDDELSERRREEYVEDSLIGVVVNKPLVVPPKESLSDDETQRSEESACVLGDLLPAESARKLKRYGLAPNSGREKKLAHEAVVARVLDLPVFNGGDVGGYFSSGSYFTILSILHEVTCQGADSSESEEHQEQVASIALTKINSIDELVQLAKDGEVDLDRCKFLIGLGNSCVAGNCFV